MAKFTRIEVVTKMSETGMVPLFYHSDIEIAKKTLKAGCNLVLYCAGNIKDNFKLIKSVPYIDQFTAKKTSEIYKILR